MNILKNDDVIFSFNGTLLDSAIVDGKVAWLRIAQSNHTVRHYFPDLFDDFSCSLGPWTPEQRTVRVTFSARVLRPIFNDGDLVAITVESRKGRRFTVRFSNFDDLLFTNLNDEIERNVA